MKVNISDMLDHTITDDHDLSPEAVDTEKIKQLALAQIQTERKGRMIHVGKRQFSLKVLVTAATLCLFTATAYAAVQFDWDERLSAYFNPDKAQKEQLSDAGLVVNKQVTENGLTVDVKQVLGDKYGVYILCDIIAPESVKLTPNYTFNGVYLSMPDSDSLGYSFTILDDDNPVDHKWTLLFNLNSSESIQGQRINLNLCDLGYYDDPVNNDNAEFKNVVPGNWKLSWVMDYQDVSQTIKVNQPVNISGTTAAFTELNISPLSISAIIKGEGIRTHDTEVSTSMRPHTESDSDATGSGNLIAVESPAADALSPAESTGNPSDAILQHITITMNDGTTLTSDFTHQSTDGDVLIVTNNFTELLDLQQVKSMTFAGVTVPLKL